MKTNYFNLRHISFYSLIGLTAISMVSCSSYKNTSAQTDGIYGSVPRDSNNEPVYTYNDGNVTQYKDGRVEGQNLNYSNYFNSLQNEYPVFTDVDNYTSHENDTIKQQQQPQSYTVYSDGSYGGWGENPSEVNVNYYGGY